MYSCFVRDCVTAWLRVSTVTVFSCLAQAQFIQMKAPATDFTRLDEIMEELAANDGLMAFEAEGVLLELLTKVNAAVRVCCVRASPY